MNAKKVFLIAILSICASSSAFAATCEQELEHAVQECADLIDQCERIRNLQALQLSTTEMILAGQKEENVFLQQQLKDARVWYRQPEVTVPATATFMLILFVTFARSK